MDRGSIPHVITVSVRDPDGTVKAFVGTICDVTGKRRTEDALLDSMEKYRIPAKNAPVGF